MELCVYSEWMMACVTKYPSVFSPLSLNRQVWSWHECLDIIDHVYEKDLKIINQYFAEIMEESHNENRSTDLSEFFELQLAEVEMLTSMYPNAGEFNITIPSVLADMNGYIAGNKNRIPNELHFSLNLDIQECKAHLDVNVALPHEYPAVKPLVSARSIGLNRHQHKELNHAISEYIESLDKGILCILPLTEWLTTSAQNYFSLQSAENETDTSTHCGNNSVGETWCRLWLYSHHIYSKFKRRDIIDFAQDLKLTGFSLPGKPGLICVEGTKKDCVEFHQQLKQLSWKKLSLVREELEESSRSSLPEFRKFASFQEISFQVRRGPAKEYHMDMGLFLQYLEDHNCNYAFHDLFGIEGHKSNEK